MDKCLQCGLCCFVNAPPFSEKELQGLPDDLRAIARWHVKHPKEDGQPCSFLNETKCMIYNHRPEECKNYPVDGEACKSVRAKGADAVRGRDEQRGVALASQFRSARARFLELQEIMDDTKRQVSFLAGRLEEHKRRPNQGEG